MFCHVALLVVSKLHLLASTEKVKYQHVRQTMEQKLQATKNCNNGKKVLLLIDFLYLTSTRESTDAFQMLLLLKCMKLPIGVYKIILKSWKVLKKLDGKELAPQTFI